MSDDKHDTMPSPSRHDAIPPAPPDDDDLCDTSPGGSADYYGDNVDPNASVPCPRCHSCFLCSGDGVCSAKNAAMWCASTRSKGKGL